LSRSQENARSIRISEHEVEDLLEDVRGMTWQTVLKTNPMPVLNENQVGTFPPNADTNTGNDHVFTTATSVPGHAYPYPQSSSTPSAFPGNMRNLVDKTNGGQPSQVNGMGYFQPSQINGMGVGPMPAMVYPPYTHPLHTQVAASRPLVPLLQVPPQTVNNSLKSSSHNSDDAKGDDGPEISARRPRVSQAEQAAILAAVNLRCSADGSRPEGPGPSKDQYAQFASQLQQYVQLLAQMLLLTSQHDAHSKLYQQCASMATELSKTKDRILEERGVSAPPRNQIKDCDDPRPAANAESDGAHRSTGSNTENAASGGSSGEAGNNDHSKDSVRIDRMFQGTNTMDMQAGDTQLDIALFDTNASFPGENSSMWKHHVDANTTASSNILALSPCKTSDRIPATATKADSGPQSAKLPPAPSASVQAAADMGKGVKIDEVPFSLFPPFLVSFVSPSLLFFFLFLLLSISLYPPPPSPPSLTT
jgi:hypothetical protein